MNDSLAGLRIGVSQSRDAHQLSLQFTIRGAGVISAPVLNERPTDCAEDVGELIDTLTAKQIDLLVMQTGVGVTALFSEAAKLGREDELRNGLTGTIGVVRGPEPFAALRKAGVTDCIQVASPYTTDELIDALCAVDLAGSSVAVVHYGERNQRLAEFLKSVCDSVMDMCLYEWELSSDLGPVVRMIDKVLNKEVDVLAFTSQIQVRHLMAIASDLGVDEELVAAMRRLVVAAIGPTCADALKRIGIEPGVVPEHPKMGFMVRELSKRFMLTAV